MALITCPECGEKISEKAGACPKCGYKFTPAETAKIKKAEQRLHTGCAIGCLAIVIIFAVIIAFSSSGLQKTEPTMSGSRKTEPQSAREELANAKVQPVFDAPSLVGKDIKGVQAVLGTPTDDDSDHPWPDGNDEHLKSWTKGKVDLIVAFHSRTNEVIDFFISLVDSTSGGSRDKKRLLAVGNLKVGESRYRVEFGEALGEPGVYAGVKAIPKTSRDDARRAEQDREDEQTAAEKKRQAEKEHQDAIEAAKWRTWTDSTGTHKTEAKFGGMAFGKIKLIKKDGTTVQVPLEKLSDEDQQWIKDRKR
jgi:hypothetical protein